MTCVMASEVDDPKYWRATLRRQAESDPINVRTGQSDEKMREELDSVIDPGL